MAYYVEPHYNPTACANIPGYWQPDGISHRMPCDTQEEAEELEKEFENASLCR